MSRLNAYKAEVLLLDILERQLWQFTPKSPEFINAQRHYLKQLRKVSHFEWPTARLEVFAKNAYAFGDTVLARELYYQLIFNAKDVNVIWFDRIAQLYLADGHYRSAARTYFQAMPYSSSLQQRRSYFLLGVKALQSGNLWPDAMNAAQIYAGVLLQDPSILEFLARLALSANRPDLAQHYVSLLLQQRISTPATGVSP